MRIQVVQAGSYCRKAFHIFLTERGLCRVLLQEQLTRASLVAALERLWADREQLTAALRDAPPADGTKRVLEMIEEVQRKA